ncbi:wax ester/triacylglycerol synthase domain-containing protein [Nonomuraea sp. NPDC049421]|uniref:wax ester/triacylglycerol synthase domain-containing protein n=1 Tax=Nonomuraea sp. NPDC049421 TaxID=3155275 RepID=UPI00342091FD
MIDRAGPSEPPCRRREPPRFDLRRHVREMACPAPGDARALLDTAAVLTGPLPPSRWAALPVTGDPAHRVRRISALLAARKKHAATASAAELFGPMLWLLAAPARSSSPSWPTPTASQTWTISPPCLRDELSGLR